MFWFVSHKKSRLTWLARLIKFWLVSPNKQQLKIDPGLRHVWQASQTWRWSRWSSRTSWRSAACQPASIFQISRSLILNMLPKYCGYYWYWTYESSWYFYFPRPFFRQYKISAQNIFSLCTTCFGTQALVTCCIQLKTWAMFPFHSRKWKWGIAYKRTKTT